MSDHAASPSTRVTSPATSRAPGPLKLAVFISGGGTTLVNLLREIDAGTIPATVSLVLADRSCRGIDHAQTREIRTELVRRRDFADVESFSDALFSHCASAGVGLVILGGFLSLIRVPEAFTNRVMNIHPSLIPAFCGPGMYGHHVHEAALSRGVKLSGCTVHFANNDYDAGPIIAQATVPVAEDDTADSLARRVFAAECQLYPQAIRLFAEGRLQVIGDRCHVAPASSPT